MTGQVICVCPEHDVVDGPFHPVLAANWLLSHPDCFTTLISADYDGDEKAQNVTVYV